MNGPELQGAYRLALVEVIDQGQLLVGPSVNDSARPRASWEESISAVSPQCDRDGDGKGQQSNEKSPVSQEPDTLFVTNRQFEIVFGINMYIYRSILRHITIIKKLQKINKYNKYNKLQVKL